jgi:glycosyltransferase involved in cell wall biosynthesis
MAGGAERYAWQLSRALVGAGARVDFVTARERGQRRREDREGIRIHRGGGRFGFYAYAASWLLRHRRGIDAVVDCEAGIPVFSPLWTAGAVPVVLVVHHVHQHQFATYLPGPLAALGRFLEGWAMPRVYRRARTVAVSESTRTEMLTQLGWGGPVEVLLNGNAAPLPVRVPAEDTADRVLVVGRLAPHKRVDLVIRAVAALRERRPALRLDIVGRGPDAGRLRQLIEDLDADKYVSVHGYLDESAKVDLIAHARLHVCASDLEGWGQVVIEAASYGVPTVARDVPGLRGSVRADRTGWLVAEPRRPDLHTVLSRMTIAIDEALRELDDPERAAEVRADCRSWARRFSWERMHREAVAHMAAVLPTTDDQSQPGASAPGEKEQAR